jgi:Cu/Zn superoxide dismutase
MRMMFSTQARWLLVVGLSSAAFVACSAEDPAPNPGGAGDSAGGSSAGTSAGSGVTGGSAGSSSVAGSGGSGAATAGTGGTGGSGAAAGGGAGAGAGGAGAGGGAGTAGGDAGAGGSGGSGAGEPTAVANITGVNGQTVTGTATFTQGATMTRLVINLTACPDGTHASHLHENKDCGNNGNAAGNHWVPNGENLMNYTCVNNMVTHEVSKPTTMWTVGDGSATDVTKYSFMVHEAGDPQPGGRIGCGVINEL